MVSVTAIAWAIICGVALGTGLWTIVSILPRLARPRLANRVAPYLVDVSEGARLFVRQWESSPLPVFGSILGPFLGNARDVAVRILGGSAVIGSRLRQVGSTMTVDAFRARQLTWAIAGVAIGTIASITAASITVAQRTSLPIVVHIVVVAMFGVGGFIARDYLLQRSAKSRLTRIASELPIVLEFLTLSLSAGEGILDSFRRVGTKSKGELAGELGRVVAEVHSGSPLAESLQRLADDIRMPELTRCIDQILGALERGTPLAEVLRAQAQDAREQSKRTLLEIAGKKEVAMMFPLVFLILPVTIIFAIFPGIFVLQVGF